MSKIADFSFSPYTRLDGIAVGDVRLNDQFWEPRRRFNVEVALPHQWDECERTGRLDNYRRALGEKECKFTKLAPDSDLYKWLEATAFSANHFDLNHLQKNLTQFLDLVSRTQELDGYLNSEYVLDKKELRWTNLGRSHEMYTGGHLIQGAIAHYRATGSRDWLNVAIKWADHLDSRFGPGREEAIDGHPEIEMALIELYRATGERRYLDLAEVMIERRGRGVAGGGKLQHQQDHLPVRDQKTVVGHVVRQLYFASGVADLFAEKGDPALLASLEAQWHDMQRKMSITGASGLLHRGEGYGKPYELPNTTAYNETCAAISNVMLNWRLLQITADSKYADLMELALYNGVLSGADLTRPVYFYCNPLEHNGDGDFHGGNDGRGANRRSDIHFDHVACCPPNMARTLASLPGYLYSVSKAGDAIYVHHFVEGRADITLGNRKITLKQRTQFPWDGQIEIEVEPAGATECSLNVRIPNWAKNPTIAVNGELINAAKQSGYATIVRSWKAGDRVSVNLPMVAELKRSDPRVMGNQNAVSLVRGPIVYCLESVDHPNVDIAGIALPADGKINAMFEKDTLGGVIVLRANGYYRKPSGAMYPSVEESLTSRSDITVKAVPYFAWANREPGAMRVWIPLELKQ